MGKLRKCYWLCDSPMGLAQGSFQPPPAISCFSMKWHHVLWCAHCVLHLTCTHFCQQNDDIDSVCAMFCANWACWSAPCFVVCPLCFAPEGLTLRKRVDFPLKWCAHAVGWLHAGWVDLAPAPSIYIYIIMDKSTSSYIIITISKATSDWSVFQVFGPDTLPSWSGGAHGQQGPTTKTERGKRHWRWKRTGFQLTLKCGKAQFLDW